MENKQPEKKQEEQSKQQEQPSQLSQPPQPKMRQIIIETDGTNINIAKADVAGNLELIAILGSILNKLNMK